MHFRAMTESTEFHGKVLTGTEAAQAYGIDDNGPQPPSHAPMLGSPGQAHPAAVGQ